MIGAGCGGAGCLGLIVIVIAAGFVYWKYQKAPATENANYNSNRGSDRNSNMKGSAPSSSSQSPGSSSSLSDDNRHKLFQAASVTHDNELLKKVNKKLALVNADGPPNDKYAEFVKHHIVWLYKNTDWIGQYNTPEKGRAYVDEHIND